MQMARAYFNSLIRQPFDTPVQSDDRLIITHPVSSPDEAVSLASANREEITQLELLGEAAQMNVRMYSAGRLPSVFFAADYGYQGEKYRFSSRYDYLLASVIFRWDLFRGFQQQEKLRQAIFDRETAESRKLDIEQKIALEAIDGWYAYQAAIKAQEVSATEEEAMKRAFDMVKRKYDNGQASLLEYTEAQTRYRESAVNRIVKKYDVYNAWFELLRITASEDINSYKTFQP
jgi:outer membrane protein